MTRFACAPTSEEVVVTSVTTVVSLRAGQWELLAFALANALAKRDISRAIAHPLVP